MGEMRDTSAPLGVSDGEAGGDEGDYVGAGFTTIV
jgi:hypothetical protein